MSALGLITLTIALGLEASLALLLIRRKIPHLFPLFFAYVVFSSIASVAKLCVLSNYRAYYFVYWSTQAVTPLLATPGLAEAFRSGFSPFLACCRYLGLPCGAVTFRPTPCISHRRPQPPTPQSAN